MQAKTLCFREKPSMTTILFFARFLSRSFPFPPPPSLVVSGAERLLGRCDRAKGIAQLAIEPGGRGRGVTGDFRD